MAASRPATSANRPAASANPASARRPRLIEHFGPARRNDGPPMLPGQGGLPQPWAIDVVATTTMGHRCGCLAWPNSIDGPPLRSRPETSGELPGLPGREPGAGAGSLPSRGHRPSHRSPRQPPGPRRGLRRQDHPPPRHQHRSRMTSPRYLRTRAGNSPAPRANLRQRSPPDSAGSGETHRRGHSNTARQYTPGTCRIATPNPAKRANRITLRDHEPGSR